MHSTPVEAAAAALAAAPHRRPRRAEGPLESLNPDPERGPGLWQRLRARLLPRRRRAGAAPEQAPALRQRLAPEAASASSSPSGSLACARPRSQDPAYVEAWRTAAAAKRQARGRCAQPPMAVRASRVLVRCFSYWSCSMW